MSAPVVIYGATGHSGGLVLRRAIAQSVTVVAAGRGGDKLRSLSDADAVSIRLAEVDDAAALQKAFAGATVVLNAAGPFSRTTRPVVDACLAAGAHYLDLSGE